MNRRKAQIRAASERLKLECEIVVDILKLIIEKDAQSVALIDSLNDRQILANTKNFLNISQFQHNALQKVSEVSLELEAFLSINDSELCAASANLSPSTLSLSSEVNTDRDTKNNISVEETVQVTSEVREKETKEVVEMDVPELDEIIDMKVEENVMVIDVSVPEKDEVIERKIEENVVVIDLNVPEKDDVIEKKVQETTAEPLCLNDAIEEIVDFIKTESSDVPEETDNKKISTSDGSVGDDTDVAAKQVSVEKPIPVVEKLKSKKLLSRKDRYLQNLPKVLMPDLSFKLSSKNVEFSDNFVSCVDSSTSSVSDKSPKDKKRKKKARSNVVIEKEEEIETLTVAHLTLQESPALQKGTLCLVSHAVSPSELYLNIADDNISIIDCMGLQIAELYGSSSCPFENKEDAWEKLGNYCVAYVDEYKIWYRCEVINWHRKGKSYLADIVTIQLVDFGHVKDVPYMNLRQLIVDFCHIPKCAVKCHFAELYPPMSTDDNLLVVWPLESLKVFNNIFYNINETVYKVVYVDYRNKHSCAIDIVDDKDDADSLTIGQQLIDAGAAVEIFQDPTTVIKHEFCVKQLQTAQGMQGITSAMADDQKLERYFDNDETQEVADLDEAMTCYKANDEARTCRFARRDGTCFKGRRCNLDHEKLRTDGVTTDKQSMYKSAFNELVLPNVGERIYLQVTNVLSINMFYACQVEEMAGSPYSAGLQRLLKLMNSEEAVAKYQHLKLTPTRGEIVVAKSWNGRWYRAQVQDVFHPTGRSEQLVQVFIVDFGELIDVTLRDLRQIVPDYLHLPFQAILCRLYNVKPIEEQVETVAKEYFESHFLCQSFNAEVMYSSASTLEVVLTKCGGEDVGLQIIEDEFGEERTDFFFPRDSELLLVD